jgi:alkylhydroperoxidase family enzyme
LLGDEALVAGVLRDLETSALDEKHKALFRFLDKVNGDSPRIAADDMTPLRDLGWDDEAIYFAVTACALFNFYNRWIDATGVHALSDEAHRQGAKRSAINGYAPASPPAEKEKA